MFIIFYIYGAVGSFLFENVNEVLWGDVAIAMLTLFRVATFEDWTDVMYETMEVYPLSWMYYLSFIFLAAFVFLNMMIGVVLDVMQREHLALDERLAEDDADVKASGGEEDSSERRLERIEGKLDRLLANSGEHAPQ
jgi:voltage-gated sodium channel